MGGAGRSGADRHACAWHSRWLRSPEGSSPAAGRSISDMMREFIASLELPGPEKERLLELAPGSYLGLAPALARGGKFGRAVEGGGGQ
jgi:hypothetical protein